MSLQKTIKQFFSYFCVGGIAALVEWGCFFLFCTVCKIWYPLATVAAFIFSTLANYILGRCWTFKSQSESKSSLKEIIAVYGVSLIGLGFNLILMVFFVNSLQIPTMLSKIAATGIVFIWNFCSRKFWIYKEKGRKCYQ